MGALEQSEHVETQKSGKNQRSLKGLLINRRFQLKYTMIVVFLAIVISAVLGILLYQRVSENTTLIVDNLRGMGAPAESIAQSQQALADRDQAVVLYLVLCLLGLVLAVMILGIYVTHKVAGPLFVMTRYLRQLGSGSLRDVRALRKGDDLVEFYNVFQETLKNLREREKDDIAALENSIRNLREQSEQLEAGAASDAIHDVIEELTRTADTLAELKKKKQEAIG